MMQHTPLPVRRATRVLWFRLLLALAAGLWAAGSAPAQTVAPDSARQRGNLLVGLSYGNNSTFFGRTQTTRYPYTAAELTYTSKAGVWASVMSYNLLNTATLLDETDLSVGWDGELSKKVDASVSYSRFLFAANSPLVKSSVNNSLDGYVGLDWGYVYSRLNAAYLFGGAQDFFVILDNSRYFEINKLFTPKGYLAIEPRVSVTAGTQQFAETSLVQQQQRGNGGGNGKGPGKVPGGTGGTPATTSTTRFRVLSYELRVPLTYHLGRVAVQGAWRYVVPVNLLPDDVSRARSYFTTSVSVSL